MQAMGATKKGGGAWKLKDFMPGKKKDVSENQLRAQAQFLAGK
jgi:hypothetical protein